MTLPPPSGALEEVKYVNKATRAEFRTRARREHRDLRAENSHTRVDQVKMLWGVDGAGRTVAHDFGTVAGTPRRGEAAQEVPTPK